MWNIRTNMISVTLGRLCRFVFSRNLYAHKVYSRSDRRILQLRTLLRKYLITILLETQPVNFSLPQNELKSLHSILKQLYCNLGIWTLDFPKMNSRTDQKLNIISCKGSWANWLVREFNPNAKNLLKALKCWKGWTSGKKAQNWDSQTFHRIKTIAILKKL